MENLLIAKFGSIDEKLLAIIQVLVELPAQQLTRMLLEISNLSREDLLARFENREN